MDATNSARWLLAKALRELADGSSEAALRSALSRSYYSIFHAANVLFGKVSHGDIADKLGAIDPKLGERVERLQQLRSQADYDPKFVEREFGGNLEKFRLDARERVNEGLTVFNRILGEIERSSGRCGWKGNLRKQAFCHISTGTSLVFWILRTITLSNW